MPLMITVGLIRKRSENYQSDGASISLTAELDQSLLNRPEALQDHIDRLYEQADTALTFRSFPAAAAAPPQDCPSDLKHQPGPGGSRALGNIDGHNAGGKEADKKVGSNGRAAGVARMTYSQRRAINVIASAMGIDPDQEARGLLGVELDQLSIRQASDLIDHLKAQSSP